MRTGAMFAVATIGLGLAIPGLAGADAPSEPGRLDHGAVARDIQLAAVSGSVTCHIDASASITHLYVRNAGAAPLPAGTRIMWGAQPGSLGGVALVGPNGLPAGDWQYVGGYLGIRDCTASLID